MAKYMRNNLDLCEIYVTHTHTQVFVYIYI